MKEPQFADVFGAAIQKTLDQDLADVATEMVTGRSYNSGKKVTPAYEHVDVFKRQEYEHRMRKADTNNTRQEGLGIIQPDDPNKPRIMVVLPNE